MRFPALQVRGKKSHAYQIAAMDLQDLKTCDADRVLPSIMHLMVETDSPDFLLLVAECSTRSGITKVSAQHCHQSIAAFTQLKTHTGNKPSDRSSHTNLRYAVML